MIRKKLALAVLCILLVSCNNAFLMLLNKDSVGTGQSKFIVIFDKNGGDKEAVPGRKVVTLPLTSVGTLPFPPKRNGYSFSEWNTKADGTGTTFTAITSVKENRTVYAQWRAIGRHN